MIPNRLLQNPPLVVIYDPINNKNKRTFCFIGNVPRAILLACKNYNKAGSNTANDLLLKEYYGGDFKKKLGLCIKNPSSAYLSQNVNNGSTIVGGNTKTQPAGMMFYGRLYDIECIKALASKKPESNIDTNIPHQIINNDGDIVITTNYDGINYVIFGGNLFSQATATKFITYEELITCDISNEEIFGANDDDDDDIEDILNSTQSRVLSREKLEFTPGVEYVTEVNIYPEDKYADIKQKIYLATNIPTYRQHLFFWHNENHTTTYITNISGLYSTAINNIQKEKSNILGIPIDRYMYDSRESIHIDAMDTLMTISSHPPDDNIIYITDLLDFTYPQQVGIENIINDNYQFNLLYYGFVIKYWPWLSKQIFYDYINNEADLAIKYPELAIPQNNIRSVLLAEKEIIDKQYCEYVKINKYSENNINIAIINAQINVYNNVIINIRNLFDNIRATELIPEIRAYVNKDGIKYSLRKTYIFGEKIQFPTIPVNQPGIIMAISLQNIAGENNVPTDRYLYLILSQNGTYTIKIQWDEENFMNFDKIVKYIKKLIAPVINSINSMGKYIFSRGESIDMISQQNIEYKNLNVRVVWKKIISSNVFKIMITLLDPYMRSLILSRLDTSTTSHFEFLFKKGIYQFDQSTIELLFNRADLLNHYSYLSDISMKQKWDQNFVGRYGKIYHRTTDVVFEISDIREKEFNIFYSQIIACIYNMAHNKQFVDAMNAIVSYAGVKKLRKLKEQDPELYNLKKHGSEKVYSRLVQSNQQPVIYTKEEIKTMRPEEKKKLIKYWNFTTAEDAYYSCPSKKYSHLGFITGVHPAGYCLPSCNKKESGVKRSKKTYTYDICINKHKYTANEPVLDDSSRHIMGYGKPLDMGRLSKFPRYISTELFMEGKKNDHTEHNLYIYGVAQHISHINDIGIVYAISEAMDMPLVKFLNNLVDKLSSADDVIFNILLGGDVINYFVNKDELIQVITSFTQSKMMMPTHGLFNQWTDLFISLVYYLYNIIIVVMNDERGDGDNIELYIPEHARLIIQSSPNKYIILAKIKEKIYPVFDINTETYFRTHEITNRLFSPTHKIIQTIKDMSKYGERMDNLKTGKIIDLTFIYDFINNDSHGRKQSIEKKYINIHNLCYAVLIKIDDQYAYLPINYSNYQADLIPISFSPFNREDYSIPHDSLINTISFINDYIETKYETGKSSGIYTYNKIVFDSYISIDDAIVGGRGHGIFYFNKIINEDKLDIPILHTQDFYKVNDAIINHKPAAIDPSISKIWDAMYKNNKYQLLLIEFIYYINAERNNNIRNSIINLINETNLKKYYTQFRTNLNSILVAYPEDLYMIHQQVKKIYGETNNKEKIINKLNTSTYSFDFTLLNTLKTLPHKQLVEELKKIIPQIATVAEINLQNNNMTFPNVFLSCKNSAEDNIPYCQNNKLIIDNGLDELIDILAADLRNPLKQKYLFGGILKNDANDYFLFEKFPLENINIYKITE